MWPEPSTAQGLLLHCLKLCYVSLPGDWFRQNSPVLLAWKVRESQAVTTDLTGERTPFSFDHLAPLGWLFQCLETGDPISLCRVIKKHPPQPLARGLSYESSWVRVAKADLSYMSAREPKALPLRGGWVWKKGLRIKQLWFKNKSHHRFIQGFGGGMFLRLYTDGLSIKDDVGYGFTLCGFC